MRIRITEVLSRDPVGMRNRQALVYRVRFTSEIVAGRALFIPAKTLASQTLVQQYFVETGYERIEHVHIWTSCNAPILQMVPSVHAGDYELVASVVAIIPLADNNSIVDVVIGDCTFAFTTRELGCATPRMGDVVSCTIIGLSLWDESF